MRTLPLGCGRLTFFTLLNIVLCDCDTRTSHRHDNITPTQQHHTDTTTPHEHDNTPRTQPHQTSNQRNMASALHQQDDSTAPQHPGAADTMTSTSFATSLLNNGKLSAAEHQTLLTLIDRKVSTAAHKDALPLSVIDNISISVSITHRQVEVIASVFDTAELLEAILVHLPAKSLILNIPLVCKGFRDAVQTSSKLKRRMYRPLESSPAETPDFFAAPIAGLKFYGNKHGIALEIVTWKMKPSASYNGLRPRQLSCQVMKSAELEIVEEEGLDEWDLTKYICDLFVQSDKGITFGEILDIVEQDQRRRTVYQFRLKTALRGDGRPSNGWRKFMDGGEMELVTF